jgi:2-polyprenyl-3-methyl-5-hydroxy-6-metoxy-1,4-benzoquinol methylase
MIDTRFFENDIIKQFTDNRIIFTNMRCLDIGSRDGLNCITLVNFGAREVVGIDIDDARFSEMEVNDKITLVKVDLLEYNDDEKFDVITCFLWNMPAPMYNEIMIKIKSLLKLNGKIYIGFHDELYKYDKYGGSVPELISKHFTRFRIIKGLQWIIEAFNSVS